MKYLKMLGLAAVAAMALMAFIGAGTASATTLDKEGVVQNKSVSIIATLEAGSSATLVDEGGSTTDTCHTSEVQGATEPPYTAASVGGAISHLTFGECSHTTKVLKNGKLSVSWIKGTNNGTVTSSEAEVTVVSTVFGISAICKTGAGTDIGTITGAATSTSHAKMDITAKNVLDCGILGKSSWTGTYIVTSPTGLRVTE
jgi:hypothetical protein